jgi:BioD-like phosphotransacetylase family protein
MISLFVDSLAEFSGRNTVCLCLGRKLLSAHKSVGFFRPLGVFPTRVDGVPTDEDMVFLKQVLGLDDALDDLCPVVFTEELFQEILSGSDVSRYSQKIRAAFEKVSKGKDIMISVGLGYPRSGMLIGLSEIDFLNEVNGKMLLTDRVGWLNRTIDRLLASKRAFEDNLAGIVFNRVEPKKRNFVDESVAPYLESHGIDVLGVIPEDSRLGAVTVGRIVQALNGELLCGEDKVDELVERFSIGAMSAEAALRRFVKMPDKAVITGGDRADIIMAAIDTRTKCLVLTGNLRPNEVVLSRARQAGVPVVVVPGDTLETVERFESIMGRMSMREEGKLDYAVELMDQYIDYDRLFEKLGI